MEGAAQGAPSPAGHLEMGGSPSCHRRWEGEVTGRTSLEMTTGACTLRKEVLRTGSLRSLTP